MCATTFVKRDFKQHLDLDWKCAGLMEEHGLTARGWKFDHDNSKRRFGLCDFTKRTIFMSKHLFPLMTEEAIVDTMLHEIAHALVGPGHGHGRVWKMKCIEIGAKPIRCGSVSKDIMGGVETHKAFAATWKYTLKCPACGVTVNFNRKPKRNRSCGKCSPYVFKTQFQMEVTQNY